MSQTRYGIRRFALLNTAGYSLGIFPLENPLSIYGANNLGKSASINAPEVRSCPPVGHELRQVTAWSSRGASTSPRTPAISSSELMLPHGPHVIGVAGRGPGRRLRPPVLRLRRRAEPGPLSEERYLPAPARAVRQPRARRHQGLRGEAGRAAPPAGRRAHVDPARPDHDPAALHQRAEPEDLPLAVHQPAAHARDHRGQAQAAVPRRLRAQPALG